MTETLLMSREQRDLVCSMAGRNCCPTSRVAMVALSGRDRYGGLTIPTRVVLSGAVIVPRLYRPT